jgi:hypothetical protein
MTAPAESCGPERFPAKWTPVRVKKTRQNKELGAIMESFLKERSVRQEDLAR